MNDAAKEARKLYKRQWQRDNREKVKGYQERYWERKAEQAATAGAANPPKKATSAK